MSIAITIERLGRLVIPKAIRDRHRLQPGTQLQLTEEDGRLVLTLAVSKPRFIERGKRLVLDLEGESVGTTHLDVRDERIRELVEYALRQ